MKTFTTTPKSKMIEMIDYQKDWSIKDLLEGIFSNDGENNNLYETFLEIPEWIGTLENDIFEGMSAENSKKWPRRFIEAIPPDIDLQKITIPFLIDLLSHANSPIQHGLGIDDDVDNAVEAVVSALKTGHNLEKAHHTAWVLDAITSEALHSDPNLDDEIWSSRDPDLVSVHAARVAASEVVSAATSAADVAVNSDNTYYANWATSSVISSAWWARVSGKASEAADAIEAARDAVNDDIVWAMWITVRAACKSVNFYEADSTPDWKWISHLLIHHLKRAK